MVESEKRHGMRNMALDLSPSVPPVRDPVPFTYTIVRRPSHGDADPAQLETEEQRG